MNYLRFNIVIMLALLCYCDEKHPDWVKKEDLKLLPTDFNAGLYSGYLDVPSTTKSLHYLLVES